MAADPPRGPNSAVPTRTMVAALGHGDLEVAAHAHRPLRQPEAVGERAQRAEAGPRPPSAAPWAPMAIRPRTSSPRSVQPSTTEATTLGGAAALLVGAADVDLHQHRGARGAPGDLGGQREPVDGLPQVHERARSARTLFRCSRPMQCQRDGAGGRPRSSRSSALAASSWG